MIWVWCVYECALLWRLVNALCCVSCLSLFLYIDNKINFSICGLKLFEIALKQSDKKVMKIAYSLYFRIPDITEKQTFQIWIRSQILVNRLKNQLLHPWSETVRFSLKASRQKGFEHCILNFLPYSRDYGKTDLPNLNKEPDSRKSS